MPTHNGDIIEILPNPIMHARTQISYASFYICVAILVLLALQNTIEILPKTHNLLHRIENIDGYPTSWV